MKGSIAALMALVGLAGCASGPGEVAQAIDPGKRFVFAEPAPRGTVLASPGESYIPERGYGFEGAMPGLAGGAVQGARPFFFSADVPREGNYRVTVVLGGDRASRTTVKAELRRLMLEGIAVPAGGSVERSFIVNVRRPEIAGGGVVDLKVPRESVQEANAWDGRITLEFNGEMPAVRSIAITEADVPTVYLLGDSTVTDQSGEPYASWGQMLTALFAPTVAVANHGESGESVSSANGRRRFAKILSLIKPGDTFITQFGHNDMKDKAPGATERYKAGLIAWVKAVRDKGAVPVLVTPMQRHSFSGGRVTDSLAPYPQLVRAAAAETGAALIDLNATSKTLYEALGERPALALFKHEADGSGRDATHHSPYGAYEIAKLVAEGLRTADVPVAANLRDDLPRFDPAKPDAEMAFAVPVSPTYTRARPLGD